MRWPVVAGIALMVGLSLPAGAEGMQPYQMVRSLHRLQDRIADGDHAALPMQRRLLGVIDERLRATDPAVFEDPRNIRALLVYGASGGNPATLESIVGRLALGERERMLSEGIVRYARGDFAGARAMLEGFDPLATEDTLAAPLALMMGALLSQEDPVGALRLFDKARLLSPGTLIEEAALRRSITLSASAHDVQRFALASRQYVRRFLRSPYASQFAESFVSAVIALQAEVDLGLVEEVVAGMTPEQARTIYLRIARQSAIEGHERLLAFASRNARKHAVEQGDERDPRAVLYANLAAVTGENAEKVLKTLKEIDAQRLSPGDRRLLRAATEIAEEVVAPPSPEAAQDATIDEEGALFLAETREKLAAIDALLREETP